MSKPEFDICVIGGGSAGLVVAAGGASLGAKVALVEKHKMGGDCLHYGCVPSKTLLQSAKVAHLIRHADAFALPAHAPQVDMAAVMERVASVIKAIEPHDSPARFRGLGVDVILGAGRFLDPHTFAVNDRRVTARRFVIATGSRAAVPPIEGIAQTPYLTNEQLFDLREPVPSLIVTGGGPIGIEMAQAFARLGSRVQVIQRGDRILPKEDPDLAAVVAAQLREEGVELLTNHDTVRVAGGAGDIRMTLKDGQGEEKQLTGSHLLIAAGRRPNIENLGLEAAGVATDKRGVVTDDRLRTSQKHIYAAGDVVGGLQFTHMAEHHAGVVLRNAIFHLPAKVERKVIPWATFSDPELARVGLSETEAKQQGIRHQVFSFPFQDLDRGRTDGATTGCAKIITSPRGKLLGAAIVGPHAGELIHEYVLALAKGMKAADLSAVIHIYPTLAQINRRVADARMKQGLTPTAKKWIKRILRLRGE